MTVTVQFQSFNWRDEGESHNSSWKKQTGDREVTAIQLYWKENAVCGGRNKKEHQCNIKRVANVGNDKTDQRIIVHTTCMHYHTLAANYITTYTQMTSDVNQRSTEALKGSYLFIYFMANGALSIDIWVLRQHSIFLRGQKWEAVSWPKLFPHICIYKDQIKGGIGIYMNYREPLYYCNGCDSYACHLCLPMKLVLVYGI